MAFLVKILNRFYKAGELSIGEMACGMHREHHIPVLAVADSYRKAGAVCSLGHGNDRLIGSKDWTFLWLF